LRVDHGLLAAGVRPAGGNAVSDILGGPPMGVMAGPAPSAGVGSGNGGLRGGTTVGRIQLSISLLFLGSVVALVLLHQFGFRFSVTVG
jgi:hypothetical protein